MESHVKIAGHPVHPVLIVLPLGLFSSAVIFDIIYLITGNAIFPTVAFYDIALGVIGGLIAAVFGFTDWLAVPGSTRAKSVGAWHGIGNVTIVVLFVISWLIRNNDPAHIPSTAALIFSFAGVLLALVTAWLGGEMVYRLGVGEDRGANLNAPNSLSGVPASTRLAGAAVAGRGSGEFEEPHEDQPGPYQPPSDRDLPGDQ